MLNINDIISESLSDHFKKHWKKYALGIGAAGLGGFYHKVVKPYNRSQDIKNGIKAGVTLTIPLIGMGATVHGLYHMGKSSGYRKQLANLMKKNTRLNNRLQQAKSQMIQKTIKIIKNPDLQNDTVKKKTLLQGERFRKFQGKTFSQLDQAKDLMNKIEHHDNKTKVLRNIIKATDHLNQFTNLI